MTSLVLAFEGVAGGQLSLPVISAIDPEARPAFIKGTTAEHDVILGFGPGAEEEDYPSLGSGGRETGVLPINPFRVALGQTPPSYGWDPADMTKSWPLAVLDEIGDYVGVALGLAATPFGMPYDPAATWPAMARSCPEGHGILALSSGVGPGVAAPLYRYAPVSLLSAIVKAAGGKWGENWVLLDAHSTPGVIRVRGRAISTQLNPYGGAPLDNRALFQQGTAVDMGLSWVAQPTPTFAFGPAGSRSTGVCLRTHPWLWGWRVRNGVVDRLYSKASTHQIGQSMLTALGGANDPSRSLALELLRGDEFYIDVTATAGYERPDLDAWPEALAAGLNPGTLDSVTLGRVTGGQVRQAIAAGKQKRVFATVSGGKGSASRTAVVTIDVARGVARRLDGTALTRASLAALPIRPTLLLRECDVSRAAMMDELESSLGVSVLDGSTSTGLLDPLYHAGVGSSQSLWTHHLLTPTPIQKLAVLVLFTSLQGQYTILP